MTDYYSVLSRAVAALEPNTAHTRSALYDRARRTLSDQMRANSPQLPELTARAVRSAFEAAVDRIEAEFAQRGAVSPRREQRARETPQQGPPIHGRNASVPRPARGYSLAAVICIVGSAAVMLIAWAVYPYVKGRTTIVAGIEGGLVRTVASHRGGSRLAEPKSTFQDLEPGTDGGSTSSGLPYFFRRQPVYYRTVYSVGMVIIDRSQRFLYLVQPQISALRYGIGVGAECASEAGLHRVSHKDEWPDWAPSPELLKRRAYPSRIAGGPGNPLGARTFHFEGKGVGIHGTNTPLSIGHAVSLGCFRMVNDDVVDLYSRVPLGTAVVVIN